MKHYKKYRHDQPLPQAPNPYETPASMLPTRGRPRKWDGLIFMIMGFCMIGMFWIGYMYAIQNRCDVPALIEKTSQNLRESETLLSDAARNLKESGELLNQLKEGV